MKMARANRGDIAMEDVVLHISESTLLSCISTVLACALAREMYPLRVLPGADHPSIRNGLLQVIRLKMRYKDSTVIAPWDVTTTLRPGTLALVQATPQCWVFNDTLHGTYLPLNSLILSL